MKWKKIKNQTAMKRNCQLSVRIDDVKSIKCVLYTECVQIIGCLLGRRYKCIWCGCEEVEKKCCRTIPESQWWFDAVSVFVFFDLLQCVYQKINGNQLVIYLAQWKCTENMTHDIIWMDIYLGYWYHWYCCTAILHTCIHFILRNKDLLTPTSFNFFFSIHFSLFFIFY